MNTCINTSCTARTLYLYLMYVRTYDLYVVCQATYLTRSELRSENPIILRWYTDIENNMRSFITRCSKSHVFTQSWNHHARDTTRYAITDDDLLSLIVPLSNRKTETETNTRTFEPIPIIHIYMNIN